MGISYNFYRGCSLLLVRCSYLILVLCIVLFNSCTVKSQEKSEQGVQIHINQLGYLTSAKKQAVIVSPDEVRFYLLDSVGNQVYEGNLLESAYWRKSGETVAVADFTAFRNPGTYRVKFGSGYSHPFSIHEDVYTSLLKSSVKAFYYNRASTELPEAHAGQFARNAGHPDTAVVVHASAASASRPAGSVIATPYGWYDAGDYNKYVVNSGISTYTLMLAYEHNKDLFDSLSWGIPASTNNTPDLLNEVLWNLEWMITMQDPEDGGVYHKTTTANFEGFVSPEDAINTRYVVAKGTAAALNFAAVLAKAAVIYEEYDPELSGTFLTRAKHAWDWAITNPDVPFTNPNADGDYPAISTGGYGDSHFEDEFFWAAVELYLATGENGFKARIDCDYVPEFRVPTWNNVETLGLFSLVSTERQLDELLKKESIDQLKALSENLIATWQASPYRITLDHFVWGSNSDILNQGMILLNAYRVFGKSEFYEAAISGLDYILGKNATGYCFVTGYGSLSPMNIHHRPSASDGIEEPVPGFLVGGPNPNNVGQDCGKDMYPSLLPARCYIDDVCSYSTNEVTINWNAPLVYVIGSIQSLYVSDFVRERNGRSF